MHLSHENRSDTGNNPEDGRLANPLAGKLIVIIDENPLILDGLCKLFREWGCEALGAQTAVEIISHHPGKAPDVILAEFHLSEGRNGMGEIISLCLHYNRHIPAGLMTDDTSPDLREEIQSSGYPLLIKPFANYKLRAMLMGLASP